MGKVRAVFYPADCITAQINRMVNMHTNPAPGFRQTSRQQPVNAVGWYLAAIRKEGGCVVGIIASDNLGSTVTVHVSGSDILIETTSGITISIRIGAVLRPVACPQIAIVFIDEPLIVGTSRGNQYF